MNIAPITSYSKIYSHKLRKTNSYNGTLNFKAYNSAIDYAMKSPISGKSDVEYFFRNIVYRAKELGRYNIVPWFQELYASENLKEDFIINILKKLQKRCTIISNDVGEEVAYVDSNLIVFKDDTGRKKVKYVATSEKRLNQERLEFTREDEDNSDIIRFFPNQNAIETYTKTTGIAPNTVSETTFYKSNGRERYLRTILNDILGI